MQLNCHYGLISNLREVYFNISKGSWFEFLQKESFLPRTIKTNKGMSPNFRNSVIPLNSLNVISRVLISSSLVSTVSFIISFS